LVCSALHKNQYLVIIAGFIPLFFRMLIEVLWLLIVTSCDDFGGHIITCGLNTRILSLLASHNWFL
jgi:hypothetical protein